MILKFGKFKGQSIESLKSSGEGISYLEWGAANLRDERMRQAFAAALASLTDHDIALVIEREDGIGYDEARRHLADERAMREEDEAREAAEQQRQAGGIARWSAESGQPAAKLQGVAHRLMSDWMSGHVPPRSQFSSDAAYEMFNRYMKEFWG